MIWFENRKFAGLNEGDDIRFAQKSDGKKQLVATFFYQPILLDDKGIVGCMGTMDKEKGLLHVIGHEEPLRASIEPVRATDLFAADPDFKTWEQLQHIVHPAETILAQIEKGNILDSRLFYFPRSDYISAYIHKSNNLLERCPPLLCSPRITAVYKQLHRPSTTD